MVADPGPGGGGNRECVDETGADGEDDAGDYHEGLVEAEDGDGGSGNDGGEDVGDEVGDGADTRAFGGGAFNGLEVKGEVVDMAVLYGLVDRKLLGIIDGKEKGLRGRDRGKGGQSIRVESHGEETGEEAREEHGALFKNPRGDGSAVSSAELQSDEHDYEQAKAENAAPDFAVRPCVCCSAPLQCKEQTHNSTDQESCTQKVNF